METWKALINKGREIKECVGVILPTSEDSITDLPRGKGMAYWIQETNWEKDSILQARTLQLLSFMAAKVNLLDQALHQGEL